MKSINIKSRDFKKKTIVPKLLRLWFIIHFFVDISVAIPLFLMPEEILGYFQWKNIDPVTTRIFAAALFGIGIESYLGRNSGIEAYSNMLNLKIIWSTFAILGLAISIINELPDVNLLLWIGIVVFTSFNILWIYWKIRLGKIKKEL